MTPFLAGLEARLLLPLRRAAEEAAARLGVVPDPDREEPEEQPSGGASVDGEATLVPALGPTISEGAGAAVPAPGATPCTGAAIAVAGREALWVLDGPAGTAPPPGQPKTSDTRPAPQGAPGSRPSLLAPFLARREPPPPHEPAATVRTGDAPPQPMLAVALLRAAPAEPERQPDHLPGSPLGPSPSGTRPAPVEAPPARYGLGERVAEDAAGPSLPPVQLRSALGDGLRAVPDAVGLPSRVSHAGGWPAAGAPKRAAFAAPGVAWIRSDSPSVPAVGVPIRSEANRPTAAVPAGPAADQSTEAAAPPMLPGQPPQTAPVPLAASRDIAGLSDPAASPVPSHLAVTPAASTGPAPSEEPFAGLLPVRARPSAQRVPLRGLPVPDEVSVPAVPAFAHPALGQVVRAMQPVLARAADFVGTPWEEAEPDAPAPAVRNTFNVAVTMSGGIGPAEREALQDAVADLLRDAARRQGLDV